MAIIKQAFFKIEYILYLYNTYPMKGTQIYIPCNTETFGVSQFPVTIPRPQDLSPCHDNFGPAEESTPVVQATLHESVRRDLDLIDQIANSRAKQREIAILFKESSPDESSFPKSFPSHPHRGQETSTHQPQAEPRSGISRENLRRPMLSSAPYSSLPNSLPANGIPP